MLCADTLPVLTRLTANLQTVRSSGPPSTVTKFAADLSNSILLDRPHASPSVRTSTVKQDVGAEPRLVTSDGGDQISIYGRGPIEVVHDYLMDAVSATQSAETATARAVARTIVNIKSPLITIALHDGYDFEASRRSVQDTIRRTRQRLDRIKRLLQEGQTPAETMDEAAGDMMRSVFLPSVMHRSTEGTTDAYERIVAFDDELTADENIPVSTQASVSTLPHPASYANPKFAAPPPKSAIRVKRLTRRKDPVIVIRLYSTRFKLVINDEYAESAWKVRVEPETIEIADNFAGSTWNMFLNELRPSDGGVLRPTGSPMATVRLQSVRGLSHTAAQELVFKAQIAPLRLHVDQDVLDFLKAFFAFGPAHMPGPAADPIAEDNSNGFVRHFEILPIKIKLDYKPRRVDYHALRQGRTIEIMNFFHFIGSEMVLRHIVLKGVPSLAEAGEMLQDLWTPDVKANQLADFLAGINPVRSVVNVGSGLADLVLLPSAHYSKDGRFMRGVHLGSRSFAKATALEATKIGAKLAAGTQVILEHAERALGGVVPGERLAPAHNGDDSDLSHSVMIEAAGSDQDDQSMADQVTPAVSKYAAPPSNAQAGVTQGYRHLSRNLKSAAQTILAVPMEVHEADTQGGTRAIIRAVPIAVLKPMIGATGAISSTLLGLQSSLDPSFRVTSQE